MRAASPSAYRTFRTSLQATPGVSVYEYIRYRRVQLAKENLLTDMSLSEVADRSGFGDYSGFLRSFRRMTGMAPNAYRKQRSSGH